MAEPAKETKRQSIKTVDAVAILAGVYLAKFSDGTVFSADIKALNGFSEEAWNALPEMVKRFLSYGIKQKLDDSMAGCETIEEAVEEVTSTWEAIVAGKWTIRVPGEGVEGGLFARAYAQFENLSLSDAKAKISELVERNFKANFDRLTSEGKQKEAGELTERMIFNRIRDTALDRHAKLKEIYEDLKAKRKTRVRTKADVQVDGL